MNEQRKLQTNINKQVHFSRKREICGNFILIYNQARKFIYNHNEIKCSVMNFCEYNVFTLLYNILNKWDRKTYTNKHVFACLCMESSLEMCIETENTICL